MARGQRMQISRIAFNLDKVERLSQQWNGLCDLCRVTSCAVTPFCLIIFFSRNGQAFQTANKISRKQQILP